jgi:hypothetical protein
MQYEAVAMPTNLIVWDLETVPDLRGFAAANDLEGKIDDEIREAPNVKSVISLWKAARMCGDDQWQF